LFLTVVGRIICSCFCCIIALMIEKDTGVIREKSATTTLIEMPWRLTIIRRHIVFVTWNSRPSRLVPTNMIRLLQMEQKISVIPKLSKKRTTSKGSPQLSKFLRFFLSNVTRPWWSACKLSPQWSYNSQSSMPLSSMEQ